ncbi:hypothetical protein ACWD42_08160, partial [Streptomyces sp. NPDC002550]
MTWRGPATPTWPGAWVVTARRPTPGSRMRRRGSLAIHFEELPGGDAGNREPRRPDGLTAEQALKQTPANLVNGRGHRTSRPPLTPLPTRPPPNPPLALPRSPATTAPPDPRADRPAAPGRPRHR